MAVQTRPEIKAEFVVGGKIKKTPIDNWIDSFVHKSEFGVTVAIPAGGGSFVLADGELLDKMIIKSATLQNVSVGTTSGGTQVINSESIAANGYYLHTEDFFANGSAITLYVTCTDAVTILIRKTVFS